jgi:hypothetical protein
MWNSTSNDNPGLTSLTVNLLIAELYSSRGEYIAKNKKILNQSARGKLIGIATQVAWNISPSNRPCNPNIFERQVAAIVAGSSTFGNDCCNLQCTSALYRVDMHFCNICVATPLQDKLQRKLHRVSGRALITYFKVFLFLKTIKNKIETKVPWKIRRISVPWYWIVHYENFITYQQYVNENVFQI